MSNLSASCSNLASAVPRDSLGVHSRAREVPAELRGGTERRTEVLIIAAGAARAQAITAANMLVRAGFSAEVFVSIASFTPSPDVVVLFAPDTAGMSSALATLRSATTAATARVVLCAPLAVVESMTRFAFDDFLVSPSDPVELAERVRRLAWRTPQTAPPAPLEQLRLGEVMIDLGGRDVYVRGEVVHLTRIEFDLLVYFATHRRRVIRRQELLEAVWSGVHSYSRTVDIHIRRLRLKLGEFGTLIKTVRGVGYKLP